MPEKPAHSSTGATKPAAPVALKLRPVAEATAPRADREPAAYQELLQGLYDAVLIADTAGHIVDANRRAQEFLQYELADLVARSVGALVLGLSAQVLAKIRDHLDSGRFTVLDATCIRRDGTRFAAEIAISRIRITAGGNLLFGIRDIERRKRTQDQLRTEHNALENCASAVAITDEAGIVTYANPAFAELWSAASAADCVGHDIRRHWQPAAAAAGILAAMQRAEPWIGELDVQRGDGHRLCVQATAAPNRDAAGDRVGMVFSFIDVTERRRAEEAIRREADVQIARARQTRDFSGSLNIVALGDLLQLLESSLRSGTLTILDDSGERRGEAAFMDGRIVFAECGGQTGETAVFALLRCASGAFDFREGHPAVLDPSIVKPVMSIILEHARVEDEGG